MSTINDFRAKLGAHLRQAELSGAPHIEVNSGELHRDVGGYPGPNHRMPVCCDAMYEMQRAGDTIVSQPAKGKGASLTIRYKLPRNTPA